MTEDPDIYTTRVLQYNIGKSYTRMQELLRDERTWQYDVIAIQEVWRSERPERDLPTTTNPISDRFYLYYPPHQGTRVSFYQQKHSNQTPPYYGLRW